MEEEFRKFKQYINKNSEVLDQINYENIDTPFIQSWEICTIISINNPKEFVGGFSTVLWNIDRRK